MDLLRVVKVFNHPAVAQADNARRVLEEALIVRGEDEGKTEGQVQIAHQVDKLRGVVSVEVGGWLVCEHERGAMHDGTRHSHALALAAGKQIGTVAARVRLGRRLPGRPWHAGGARCAPTP